MSDNVILLPGCRSEPLAGYLKGLGVFRIISLQLDPSAESWWDNDSLMIQSKKTLDEIEEFFLHGYSPTPVLAPWNGGSGFYPKDKSARDKGLEPLRNSTAPRFERYRDSIELCVSTLTRLNLTEKPSPEEKYNLLKELRNNADDYFLEWLDSAFVLVEQDVSYPPILGTGGNDGRLEFTSNLMQRISSGFGMTDGKPLKGMADQFKASLFETASPSMIPAKIGQYYPGAAGGANAGMGYDSDSYINPWDFILLIEGAILFITSCHRSMTSVQRSIMVSPFTMRPSAGFNTLTAEDSSSGRAEFWAPLWSRPVRLNEIRYLFSEGRVELQRRRAVSGVDFARSIAELGVDRGITGFQRYGFHVRNGLSYLATSLGRWHTRFNRSASILNEIDSWMDRLRSASKDKVAPGRIVRAFQRLETSVMAFCQNANRFTRENLIAGIVHAERAIAGSRKYAKEKFLSPIPQLSTNWLQLADLSSTEYRIAEALTGIQRTKYSVSFRDHLEPLSPGISRYRTWSDKEILHHVVYQPHDPVGSLGRIMMRRLMDSKRSGESGLPLISSTYAPLGAVMTFLEGSFNEAVLDLYIAFTSFTTHRSLVNEEMPTGFDSSVYTILKLCHLPWCIENHPVRFEYKILNLLWRGDLAGAVQSASRRLRVAGLKPKINVVPDLSQSSRHLLAALLIPISTQSVSWLASRDLIPEENNDLDNKNQIIRLQEYQKGDMT